MSNKYIQPKLNYKSVTYIPYSCKKAENYYRMNNF